MNNIYRDIEERQKAMARNLTNEELIAYANRVGTVLERELASRLAVELDAQERCRIKPMGEQK